MAKKKGIGKAAGLLTLLVLVIGLAVGVVGLQKTRNLTTSKASSGCTIVQTDQGPGCWCSDGGWQFHCGVPNGQPAPDQCINDCSARNTNVGDNTPKADKCDKGKTGGPCSGQYRYSCGGDGCKAECNNYPKLGRWVLTGDKNCGKPGDIKPKPTGAPTPTPTPKSKPKPTPTPTPVGKLSTPIVSCDFVKVNQDVIAKFDWNNIKGADGYIVYIIMTKGNKETYLVNINQSDSEYSLAIFEKAAYTAKVRAIIGDTYESASDYGVKSCRYTGG